MELQQTVYASEKRQNEFENIARNIEGVTFQSQPWNPLNDRVIICFKDISACAAFNYELGRFDAQKKIKEILDLI